MSDIHPQGELTEELPRSHGGEAGRRGRRSRAVGAALLWSSLIAVQAAPAPAPGSIDARLARLVESLAGAERADRSAFARIALGAMIDEHEHALRAMTGGATEDSRWAAATAAYVGSLRASLAAIDLGAGVELAHSREGFLVVSIDRRPVIVSSLHVGARRRLAGRVVAAYCAERECDGATPPATARAAWSLEDGPRAVLETDDGLAFVFPDVRDRSRKEAACLEVALELRALAGRLGAMARTGHRLEWEHLRLEPGARGEQRLIFNREGGFVAVFLPRLVRAAPVLEAAIPWLRATVEGRAHRQRIPAGRLVGRLGDRAAPRRAPH